MSSNPFEDFRKKVEYTNKSVEERYKITRGKLLSTKRRLERAEYKVDIDIPKIPKKITESSVRKIEKALSDLRYSIHHAGKAHADSIRQQRINRPDYIQKQNERKHLAEMKKAKKAGKKLNKKVKKEVKKLKPGLPDYDTMQIENLEKLINDAIYGNNRKYGKGISDKQSEYFSLVDKKSEEAREFFDNLGLNFKTSDRDLIKEVVNKNLKGNYEKIADMLEHWLFYDSEGGYTNTNIQPLVVIGKILTAGLSEAEQQKKQRLLNKYYKEDEDV